MKRYLQYGCGFSAPPSFENFDNSPTLRYERLPLIGKIYTRNSRRFPPEVRYGDIVRGLPVPDSWFAGVYCSHVLEHLTPPDLRIALRNSHALLRPGGLFRLVLPDLEALSKAYVNNAEHDASVRFLQSMWMREYAPKSGWRHRLVELFGHQYHMWMWDYRSLTHELEAAGFTKTRRAEMNDSNDPIFLEVEDRGRWEGCLGIECVK
jgi:SAM-dependent methyltransferase